MVSTRRRGRVATPLLLVALVATTLVAPATGAVAADDVAPGGSFVDDDGSIHEPNIETLARVGIVRGCDPPRNVLYCPEDSLTRGQAATLLVRALDLASSSVDAFVDDGGSVHEANINALAATGITKGCNPPANDRYCPDHGLTRGQLAALLERALDLPPSPVDHFVDDDHSIFVSSIDALAAAGITKGCNPPANDRFCPDDPVRRDQAATFLTRALGLTPTAVPDRDPAARTAILEEHLVDKGFLRPASVGVAARLEAAIITFHKELGVARTAQWSTADWAALARYSGPDLRARPGQPDRVEIDLTKQVLYLVRGGDVVALIPVSSGNGAVFRTSGGWAVARTPRGSFTFLRHIAGWRFSPLGGLYKPWYFYGGYAVHGSLSVPPYPASHGCVRVPTWEADYLQGELWVGMPIHVWDS